MKPSKNPFLLNLLMAVSMAIWGGSWVSAKLIAQTLRPETVSFWRFVLTSVFLFPVVLMRKDPLRLDRKAAFYTLAGSLFMGLYFYLFFKGLSVGHAGAAGVLVTTTAPLATLILSMIFLGKKASGREIIGLVMGLGAGAILLETWTLESGILAGGNAYFLLSAILWAALTICSQRAGEASSALLFSFFSSLFSAALLLIPAVSGGMLDVFKEGPLFWMNMLYLSAVSSAFATTIYFLASERLTSYRASSFIFLVPLSAVILSWIFLGETPKIATVAGGLTAIAATCIINVKS